jgi:hypothetical protein
MLSIPITQPITATGTDSHYVELHLRRLGARVELRAIDIQYFAVTGRYDADELGVEIVDEEEAIDAASDLEALAERHLEATGDLGRCDQGWGEAVEAILYPAHAHAIAAE